MKPPTLRLHTPTEDNHTWVLSMADPYSRLLRRDVRCTPTLGNERRCLRIVIRDKLEAEDELSERWQALLRVRVAWLRWAPDSGAPYRHVRCLRTGRYQFDIEPEHSCTEIANTTFQRDITTSLREIIRVCSPEFV